MKCLPTLLSVYNSSRIKAESKTPGDLFCILYHKENHLVEGGDISKCALLSKYLQLTIELSCKTDGFLCSIPSLRQACMSCICWVSCKNDEMAWQIVCLFVSYSSVLMSTQNSGQLTNLMAGQNMPTMKLKGTLLVNLVKKEIMISHLDVLWVL